MKKQTITEKRNEQIMKKKRPLSKKILMAMLSVVLILGVISGVVFYYAIHKVSDDVRQITDDMGQTTYHGSGAMTRSPSPLAWRPDFPGAPREAH